LFNRLRYYPDYLLRTIVTIVSRIFTDYLPIVKIQSEAFRAAMVSFMVYLSAFDATFELAQKESNRSIVAEVISARANYTRWRKA